MAPGQRAGDDLCVCVQVVLPRSQPHSDRVGGSGPQSTSVLLRLSGPPGPCPQLLRPQVSFLPQQLVPQRLCAGVLCVPVCYAMLVALVAH